MELPRKGICEKIPRLEREAGSRRWALRSEVQGVSDRQNGTIVETETTADLSDLPRAVRIILKNMMLVKDQRNFKDCRSKRRYKL